MDKYEVGAAAAKLYDFTWNVFCDYYIEFCKADIGSCDNGTVLSAKSTLCYVYRELLKMLHPIIPFITEEIYKELPNVDADSIMISSFPKPGKKFPAEFKIIEKIITLVKSIRTLRNEKGVPQSKKVTLYMEPKPEIAASVKMCTGYLEKLCGISEVIFSAPPSSATELVTPVCSAYILTGDLVDTVAEKQRLTKELVFCSSELALASRKLNNEGFTSKAPKALIDAEREKVEKYKTLIKELTESINKL